MQLIWQVLLVGALCGMLVIWFTTDDWLLWHLRFLKRRDTDLQLTNLQIVAGLVVALVTGSLLMYLADIPLSMAITLLSATIYLTVTFYFNCCLFHIGARRELLWVLFFGACCLASLLATGWLKMEYIIPVGALGTAYLCWDAVRDGYAHYRKGLRHMERGDAPELAVHALSEACRLTPDDARFHYHLGRAHLAAGQHSTGGESLKEALALAPDLITNLRRDPLFRDDWLVDDPTVED